MYLSHKYSPLLHLVRRFRCETRQSEAAARPRTIATVPESVWASSAPAASSDRTVVTVPFHTDEPEAFSNTGQFVKAGEIILRQRGTSWHPGENVKMGRDHTLYAVEPGFVCFYRPNPIPKDAETKVESLSAKLAGLKISPFDKIKVQPKMELVKSHPSASLLKRKLGRRYIGVTLTRDEVLPREVGAPRVRRLGLVDWAREQRLAEELEQEDHEQPELLTELREETRDDGVSKISTA